MVSATALVVSNMIGTGIFTTTGFLAGDLGSPSLVLWIWVVGAAIAFIGAMCYSELGVNLPSSGGEYVYLTEAFGPTWGFMTGWVSFFAGFSAPIAVAALAFADYVGYFFPECFRKTPAPSRATAIGLSGWAALKWLACVLIAVFTVLNVVGVQRAARVQNFLTALKVAVIVSFIAFGFLAGHGEAGNFSRSAIRDSANPLPEQFAISLFFVFFAYSGWNAATYVAEELRHPARTLPIALAIGTGLVAVLYLGLNLIFIYAAPLQDLKGKVAVGAFAASRLFGPNVAGLFAALMALSLMATVNAMVTIGPRVYYAMAKNGAFLASAAEVASQVAHSRGGHRRAGRLRHAAQRDAISPTGDLHRLHAEFFRRDERGVAVLAAPPPGLAEAARGELRLSSTSGAVCDGGALDDDSRRGVEAVGFAGGGGDHRHRSAGLPLALEIEPYQ